MIVKLIASDIDGTLLVGNERKVSDKVISYIDKLHKRGVVFVAASGRQYGNLRNLFEDVNDKIAYICENGALVKYKGETILKNPMNKEMGLAILNDIYKVNGCEFLLSGEEVSYIKPKASDYKEHIENYVGNKVKVIEDYSEADEEFIKISVYCKSGIEKHARYFHDKWGDKVKTTVSGKCWLDFVAQDVNKGNALRTLKEYFGVDYEETMSFGDNYNDLEMFEESYYSYAMSSASKDIRSYAKFVTPNVESILFDVDMMYEWQK